MNRTLTIAALTLLASGAFAAPRRIGGGFGNDTGTGLAVDGGRVITVGTADMGAGRGNDIIVTFRDPLGAVIAVQFYDGGLGVDEHSPKIVADGFGNVFVAATADNPANKDIVLLKYTINGAFLGRKYFNGPANRDDFARDIAYDPANFVVVAGATQAPGGDTDALVWRVMDNLGADAFRTRNGTANGNDVYNAVHAVPFGPMYLTGKVANAGTADDVIFDNISPGMALLNTRQFNSPFNLNDEAVDIEVDGMGRAVLAGDTQSPASGTDIMVVRLAPMGALAQVTRMNSGGANNDTCAQVKIGPANSIYVAGTANRASLDYVVFRIKPNFLIGGGAFYDGPAAGPDSAASIVVYPTGQVCVTGASAGAGTGLDSATVMFDPAFAPLWANRYDFAGGPDAGTDIVAIGNDVFVAGSSSNGADLDQTTDRMVAGTGVSLW